jgi:hypothetical protein
MEWVLFQEQIPSAGRQADCRDEILDDEGSEYGMIFG